MLVDSLIVLWSFDVKQDIHTHLKYIITPYVVLYHGDQTISSNGLTLYLYKMYHIVNVLTIRCDVNVLAIYFHEMLFFQLIKFRLFEYWINIHVLMQSFWQTFWTFQTLNTQLHIPRIILVKFKKNNSWR
jgi:hypothetical protein